MKIQLIHGHFNSNDALNLISQMIGVKIKYQEDKINATTNEEDIKMRERRIKELQNDLATVRKKLIETNTMVDIEAVISI